ncbi:MAG: hypothetical protein K2P75_07660 [Sphingobacteriaceae bacterium]|nr:hypothetical protein [Sphingobacteriaceae bacterium]
MKKYFLFFVFLFLINNNLFADTGCLKGCQVYINSQSGWNQWTSPIPDNCSGGFTAATTYAYVNSITSNSCSIGFIGWRGSGFLVDYSIMNCRIDDYIPVLTGSTYFLFLKRFTRKNTYNEIL